MSSVSPIVRKVALGGGVFGVAVALLVLSRRPLSDYDLPWNLATGRWIAHLGAIPKVDDLAFTRGALSYVEVLGDLALWQIDRTFGARGLQVLGAVLAVGCTGATFARMRETGPLAIVLGAWLGGAIAPWFTVRPASISLFLLPVALSILDAHRRTPSHAERLLVVVPLAFVWANVHGLVALFAGLLVAHAATTVLAARRRPGGARDATATLVVTASALAAASVNTLGPALLLGPLRSSEPLGAITEWARPTPHFFLQEVPVATALFAFSVVVIALGREPDSRRTLPPFDAVLVVVALAGFFGVVRLTPIALILVVPIAARRVAPFVPRTTLVTATAAIAPAAAAAYLVLFVPAAAAAGFDEARLPVAATGFVERVAPAGQMYDFSPFGGYLAYRLHPRYRVFMDGRNALARSPELVRRAVAADQQPEAFDALVREYSLEWAVTSAIDGESHDLPLARSPRWQMIYLDDVAAVYVRREGPNAALASRGYRALRHHVNPGEVIEAAVRGGDMAAALFHDGPLALEQAPESPRACFLAAAAGIAGRDPSLFDRARRELGRLAPHHPALSLLDRAWGAVAAEAGAPR